MFYPHDDDDSTGGKNDIVDENHALGLCTSIGAQWVLGYRKVYKATVKVIERETRGQIEIVPAQLRPTV